MVYEAQRFLRPATGYLILPSLCMVALRHFLQYFLRLNFSLVLMTFFSVT